MEPLKTLKLRSSVEVSDAGNSVLGVGEVRAEKTVNTTVKFWTVVRIMKRPFPVCSVRKTGADDAAPLPPTPPAVLPLPLPPATHPRSRSRRTVAAGRN